MDKVWYEECGCCGGFHRPEFRGDCRDDSQRFTADKLDKMHGGDKGWDYLSVEDQEHGITIDNLKDT